MEESVTFQDILRQGMEKGREQGREQGIELGIEAGELAGLREAITELASETGLGTPGPETAQKLEAITDLARLKAMLRAVIHTTSWAELLNA